MSVLLAILGILLATVAAFVLLSYAIAWYEYSNREPQLLEERFAPEHLLLAVRLVLVETACLFVTLLLRPAGWFRPRQQPAAEAGTPVLLLHGLFHNRACWLWFGHQLRRHGFASVHAINLPPWEDVATLTERVARKVEELRHDLGVEKVHLVGHSMGGMIARHYLQLADGAGQVGCCVLLGSPNGGSRLAPFALSPLGRLLTPGSDFLRQLAEAPLPAGVRMTSVYSRHDNIVLPFELARLEGGDNVELAEMGHVTLLYHPRALEAVIAGLGDQKP